MREYKVTYETTPLGHVTIRDSHIVTAESKQEAAEIAKPSNCKLISVRLMPIKKVKKPFDITKHEFSDTGIECCEIGGGVLTIHNPELTTNLLFDDAIAIARAFGVTGEDLK